MTIKGRLTRKQLPDGRSEHYEHDACGQVIGYRDPAGNTTYFQHALSGQLHQRIDAHGRRVTLNHDAYGRLQSLTNENGERYRFDWDAGDRLTQEHRLDGSLKRYAYDPLDNVTQVETIAVHGTETAIIHDLERDAQVGWSPRTPWMGAPNIAMTSWIKSHPSRSPGVTANRVWDSVMTSSANWFSNTVPPAVWNSRYDDAGQSGSDPAS